MAEKDTNNEKKLPNGWCREIRKRKSGKTAGKIDIYFYSPDNKVFRSKKSLLIYLQQNHLMLNIEDFNFNVLKEEKDEMQIKVSNNYEINTNSFEEKEYLKEENVIFKNCETCTQVEKKESTVKDFQSDKYKSSEDKNVKEEMIKLVSGNQGKTLSKERNKYEINLQKRSPYFTIRSKLGKLSEPIPNYFKSLSKWNPPRSPFNLIQEDLYHDPWKMLVATICLQKTTGKAVKRVLSQLFQKYPTPDALLQSDASDITNILQPLGLQEKKTKILSRFSEEFISKKWRYPIELHGIGKYGNDSYRIFCVNEWKEVVPKDHMLEKYHQWLKNQSSKS